MIAYVDTSIVLRVLLRQADPFSEWGNWEQAFVSELVQVEFLRTIDRLRLQGAIEDEGRIQLRQDFDVFWSGCHRVSLSPPILKRAGESFPTIVGSLDALHLATALLLEAKLGLPIVFCTHDNPLSRACRAMGMIVKPF